MILDINFNNKGDLKMNCTIMTITPDMASEMLMHNKNNRKLRKYAVNTFADDMLR